MWLPRSGQWDDIQSGQEVRIGVHAVLLGKAALKVHRVFSLHPDSITCLYKLAIPSRLPKISESIVKASQNLDQQSYSLSITYLKFSVANLID